MGIIIIGKFVKGRTQRNTVEEFREQGQRAESSNQIEKVEYSIKEKLEDLNKVNNEVIDRQNRRNRLEQQIEELKQQHRALQAEYQALDENFRIKQRQKNEELERELRNKRSEFESRLNMEIKEKREEADRSLAQEKAERQQALQKKIQEEEAKVLEELSKNISYTKRQEENKAYLDVVKTDIERRVQFEGELCEAMNQTSRVFKEGTRQLITRFEDKNQEIVALLENNMKTVIEQFQYETANAVNQIVNTERKIEKDDYEDLLRSFGELQQKLYYKVPEEQLGLHATEIEKFQKRFLKTLNRMGYEQIEPEIGSVYDEELYEIGVARDDDETKDWDEAVEHTKSNLVVVSGVIEYGFKKNNEICKKAVVTIKIKDEKS